MAKDRSCFRIKDVREASLGAHGSCNGARAWGGDLRHKGNHGVWILGRFKKNPKTPPVAPTFSSGRLPALVDGKTEVEEEARELGMSVTRLEGL